MLGFTPCWRDREIEAVADSEISKAAHSPRALICVSGSPAFPSSLTASFARWKEKKLKPTRALTTDPQHFGTAWGSRGGTDIRGKGARGAEGGGHPGPWAAFPELGELHPKPRVPSPFLLIVVALRALGGKCHPAGLDFSARKGSKECFVSSLG